MNEEVASIVQRELEIKRLAAKEKHEQELAKDMNNQQKYKEFECIRLNCLNSLKKLKNIHVNDFTGQISFDHPDHTLTLYTKMETWEIGSDEKPVEVTGWCLFCMNKSHEVCSISDIKDSGRFIQELGKAVAERIKI